MRNNSTLHILKKIWGYLSLRRKLQLVILLFSMLVSGAAEVFTLASIIPFLAILNDPDFIWKIDIVRQLSQFFGVSSSSELLLPFTVIFVISAVLASFIRILNLWFSGRMLQLLVQI